ncbi:DUF420 domain-containing protein [Verrucomicrobiales bacterium BCK34]|nr:DUF420 domain-containing protein [Verrucomicrobiales bacterium BCK34]
MELLAAFSYESLPPINAILNSISAILLVTGVLLIKAGKKEAHKRAMVGALISSALFLTSYLIYHYTARHTTFPKEYPVARIVYLSILIPHVILAVVNLPFIIMLVVAAFRGNFEKHKKLARFTCPSWLFVSVTGVIIYLMIYQWFPPSTDSADSAVNPSGPSEKVEALSGATRLGDIVYESTLHEVKAQAGQDRVEVSFKISNKGKEPVKVTQMDSGCACLAVEISENPISAGGTAIITGVFDTSKMRGSTEKKITVSTEGQKHPVFLKTKIHIDPLYDVIESMTTWSVGSNPEPKIVKFNVKRSKPIHVLGAESMRKEVACEVLEVEKGREYHLKLTPDSTAETLLGFVRIETDCEIEQLARPLAYFSIQ